MILLIDNYDSFSYNLYQLIGALNPEIRVIRNDAMSVEEIREMKPSHIKSLTFFFDIDITVCHKVICDRDNAAKVLDSIVNDTVRGRGSQRNSAALCHLSESR